MKVPNPDRINKFIDIQYLHPYPCPICNPSEYDAKERKKMLQKLMMAAAKYGELLYLTISSDGRYVLGSESGFLKEFFDSEKDVLEYLENL